MTKYFNETGSNSKRKSVRTRRKCTCVAGLFAGDRKTIFSTTHQRIPKTQEAPKIKHTIVMAYKICHVFKLCHEECMLMLT